MAHRRKPEDAILIAAQLIGGLMLLGVLSPRVRALLDAFVALVAVLVGVAVVGIAGFVVYRLLRGRGTVPPIEKFPASTSLDSEGSTDQTEPSRPDLTEQIRAIDWFQFEILMAVLYRKQGYTVTRRGGANADGGIDLIIEKGGVQTAVQCKQWRTWNVGVKGVREFLGALTDAGLRNGIFITLRGYTGEAKQLAEKHGIEILHESGLTRLLDAADASFDPEILDILNDTRKFCPKCERPMVLRTATKGAGAGQKFWGCSSYPRCHFTMPM